MAAELSTVREALDSERETRGKQVASVENMLKLAEQRNAVEAEEAHREAEVEARSAAAEWLR